MVQSRQAFVNGHFIEEEKAFVHISDLALLRGYGIFDFFKVVANNPVFLHDHLTRFYFSAAQMRLNPGMNKAELEAIIYELLQQNNLPFSGVRMTLTGGSSADGYNPGIPALIITQQPLPTPGKMLFDKGLRLITYPHQRQLPHVKTIDYLMPVWLQPTIKTKGADDVLYHQNGFVTECPRSNFFMVKGQNLVTPATNILEGITRKKILDIAGTDFKIEEREVSIAEIHGADEAFICSTSKAILPVVEINGQAIGNGQPGAATLQLYRRLTSLWQ